MKIWRLVVVTAIFVLTFQASANTDISGVWKHSDKPALIEFDLKSGLATVKQHDDNQSATGLTVIKDINSDSEIMHVWTGNMYNGYIDSYVAVTIKLIDNSTIVVIDNKESEVLRLVRE
ncbi:hypothetical protein ISG33_13640 [Glaciecola sp. MH2013]|uniref:hypothetical protein n=1 Tax=Glaciecola sp. MH2013 TaxID=2785524 RepID=UPI00189DD685|nr:hypothetical protein [Glaciecola sp. MH2013]MBF7074444.1 hypothetical protein [Glaciecola sp. MH2013]